jgi:hypothetical protein
MPHPENERQRSINDFWSCVLGNDTSNRVYSVIKEFLAAFIGKQIAIPSMPHHENERQQSVNDIWLFILGNDTSNRVHSVIKEFLAVFIGKTDCNTLHAPL